MQIPEINIGIERVNHKQFDDAQSICDLEFPTKICSIKIQHNDEYIVGIKIQYQGANGKKANGQLRMIFRGLMIGVKTTKIQIADGDFIKQIYGYASLYIHQFGFTTYYGETYSCGNAKGEGFSHHFPNHTFTSAKGTYDKYLEFISFKVVPLTEIQLQRLDIGVLEHKQQQQQEQKQQKQTNISEKMEKTTEKFVVKAFNAGAFLSTKIAQATINQ